MKDDGVSQSEWVRRLLELYERPLVAYATRITGDLDLARDVVQDVFLRLCRVQRRKVEEHIPAWLYRVCRNRALDVMKKESRSRRMADEEMEAISGVTPGPESASSREEIKRLVLEEISNLPPDQREAVCLKFNDELTYREISRVMGMSLGAVSNLMAASLSALRGLLREKLDLLEEP